MVAATLIYIKKGFFATYWSRREHREGIARIVLKWRVFHAGEDHIPITTRPTADHTIARKPLLLGAGVDISCYLRVGDKSAARKVAAGIRQFYRVIDQHAPERSSLRNAPLQGARSRRCHFQVLHRTPEGLRVIPIDQFIRFQEALAEIDGAGSLAEASNRLIEPHLGFDAGIGAGFEKHCGAASIKLSVTGQRCERRINRCGRHTRVNDIYIWPKVGLGLSDSSIANGEKHCQH